MKHLFEEGNNLYKKYKQQLAQAAWNKRAKREEEEELSLIKEFLKATRRPRKATNK